MSVMSKIDDALEIAKVATTAVGLIRDIVKHYREKDSNIDAIGMIGKVADGAFDALQGNRTPAEIRADILKVKAQLATEDTAADAAGDAALDKKFPKKDPRD